jgi:hypothetical protein
VVQRLLKALKIPVKKGLDKEIQIYRRRPHGLGASSGIPEIQQGIITGLSYE